MTSFIEYPEGATPLDPDEIKGLIPQYISTQGELNVLEQANILEAQNWAKSKPKDVLHEGFVRELHKRMFKNVWKWAGEYRTSGKNIGVSYEQIREELSKICSDAKYWIEHKSYGWLDIGVRFHHRLVLIHAFPNGNGRHARLMTDILLEAHDQDAFSWGAKAIERGTEDATAIRDQYLVALREADQKKFEKLTKFVRS